MEAPVVITHSDIAAFLRCRRQWAWGYIDDVKKAEGVTGAAKLGTRVHSALEAYYVRGDDPVEVHDQLARADILMLETTDAPGWEVDQLYTEMILGRNCVIVHQDWLARTGADSEFDVFAVEPKLEAPILDGRVMLRGKVDIIYRSRNDGLLYTNDWKTTGAQGSVREMFERSYQAPTYQVLASVIPDAPEVGGSYYTVIRKTKNPARATRELVERFRVPASRRTAQTKLRQIEAICVDMLRLIDEYDRTDPANAYPTPAESCRWCDYKMPCELMDESPESALAMLGAEYQQGGKHERYDRA